MIAIIVADNSVNVFAIFANILATILRLVIIATNQLFSISITTIANIESVQPMAPVSAQFKSSGRTFTMSTDDLKNIIANVIRMVGTAFYFSSLSALFGMSPSS